MTLDELTQYIDSIIQDYTNKTDLEKQNIYDKVIAEMCNFSEVDLPPTLKGKLFIIISMPNSAGFSKRISTDDLVKINTSFKTTNGGDWNRTNISFLGKRFEIKREKIKGRIAYIKLEGFNKNRTINQTIRSDIKKEIAKQKCSILYTGSQIECDHKDGMKDDWKLNDIELQKITDFQPLSKAANDAKRSHCKRCKETKKRFDAKVLGYKESFTMGDENSNVCNGCYWHDPKAFNELISKNFIKNV